MCGICAIAGSALENATTGLEAMIAALAHRGPDGSGLLRLPGCHLGHRRLSIIDLKTGSQPMQDTSARYSITFNGEIYNYKELRQELLTMGHQFRTTSDTEVILSAFAQWGAEFLHRFRGMFAFAIWDARQRTLFAARDLFGEKPLYYAVSPGGLLILASEIKALQASGLLQPRLDLDSVEAYLALGYVPPDRTIYENVQTVPPGHYLEWDGTSTRVTRYWRPRLEPHPITLEEAAERLEALVRQAVRRQMVADVPVGAFLSGGLDSSTVVAMMSAETRQPIRTFAVGFDKYVDELPYARSVAERYRTDHHELTLGAPPVAELLQTMARVYDEPLRDSSAIPTYLISQYARGHVKVVLSGDGGDELFGGYTWYPRLAKPDEVSNSWFQWVALGAASRLLGHRVPSLARRARAVAVARRWPEMVSRYMEYVIDRNSERRRLLWGSRHRHTSRFLPGEYYRPPDSTSGLNRAFHFDMTSWLPGDILVKVDRAAMAHGLETRAPLLDRDLVEFIMTLPATLKVRGEQTKIVFKHAFSRYWPESLRTRSKQGFGAPFEAWMERPDVQALSARVFAAGSRLRDLLPGFDGVSPEMSRERRWTLLMLGLWLEEHRISA